MRASMASWGSRKQRRWNMPHRYPGECRLPGYIRTPLLEATLTSRPEMEAQIVAVILWADG